MYLQPKHRIDSLMLYLLQHWQYLREREKIARIDEYMPGTHRSRTLHEDMGQGEAVSFSLPTPLVYLHYIAL